MHVSIATAPGSAHINPGQPGKINNQDVVLRIDRPDGLVAVLCDGCGSQPNSATGADIGAKLVAKALTSQLDRGVVPDKLDWEQVESEVCEQIAAIAKTMTRGDQRADFEKTIESTFLFTIIALVIAGDAVAVAHLGDGVLIVEDDATILDPPIKNSPPYLAYNLLTKTAYHDPNLVKHLSFTVFVAFDLKKLEKGLVVATDGFKPLVGEDFHHPSLVQKTNLQRWLNIHTAERIESGTFVPGQCRDDVSLVIARSDEAQNKLLAARHEMVVLKGQITKLTGKVDDLTAKLATTTAEAKAFEEECTSLEAEVKRLKRELGKLEALSEMAPKLLAKAKEFDGVTGRGQLRRLATELVELTRVKKVTVRPPGFLGTIGSLLSGKPASSTKIVVEDDGGDPGGTFITTCG